MPLEPDIIDRVRKDFGEEAEVALDLIRGFGKSGYLARCVVVASRGSIVRLKQAIEAARFDYRDAIVAGEYDSAGRRVRDLSVSFLLDTPETFWISGVASMMASRGYALRSLTTRDTTAPPFQFSLDFVEGSATFAGAEAEITVEKKDRKWNVHGDRGELDRYHLNRSFDNESVFRDALSGYLLMRARAEA